MTEIRNPAKLSTDLKPAEEYFVRCLAEGKRCIIGKGELPGPEDQIEFGEGANVVRGEVIRFFAYGGNEENPVLGSIVELQGAWISEDLDLTHASIPYALDFSNCHFAASVVMEHTECASLYLNGSRLAQGLKADGLTTKNSVYLRSGFSAKGEVRLVSASIGGHLDCTNGKFHNPNKYAILADSLTTTGSVNLRDGFSAKGGVRLLGAKIDGNLDCWSGKFGKSKGYALNVNGGNVSGGLIWRETICKGDVNLAHARVDVLADDATSWKSCKVDMKGFIYNRFSSPMDTQSRLRWLARRPGGMEFSPVPYEQVAKVLFGMGHAHDARKILLEKERLQTKDRKMHWLRKVGRRLWDIFAGYGYRLSYTVAWIAFFVVAGAMIFGVADLYGNIVPTHPVVALSEGYKGEIVPDGDLLPTQAVEPEYPAFNPLVFSLDVFTPSAVFHQEDSWGPRAGGEVWWTSLLLVFVFLCVALALCFSWFAVIVLLSWLGCIEKRKQGLLCGCGLGAGVIIVLTGLAFLYVGFLNILWLLTLWYWFEVAMGWILTSMLLLSVTGLLRPRQSSGEKD